VVTRRVLVTGATGGLGRILVPMLCARGWTVTATGRNRAVGAQLGTAFISADLARDEFSNLVSGYDTIIHLAALSSPWGKRAEFESANVLATTRLLDAARQSECSTFIYTSTPSIYADTHHQIGLTEQSPLPKRFANDYAATKYEAERHVRDAAHGAISTVTLRPRAIISPYDTALLPRLLRAAAKGRMPLPDGGDALIELTDARDVAQAIIAATERASEISGQAFNISGGAPRPLREIAEMVFKQLGLSVNLKRINARLLMTAASTAEAIARLLPGQPEPFFTRYSAMTLSWSQTFDLSAARDQLMWEPKYSPEAAIAWALEGRSHA
jgi:2-alkyl-3-oxoalkanoate reductase